jgi:hypothetical protein
MTRQSAESFWAKVDRGGPDECWPWLASKTPKMGYGRVRWGAKIESAHRIAYMLHYGFMPEAHICHSCDNPACCNPRHLWAGTAADNMRDRDRKRRNKQPKGERNGRAKLTQQQVLEIRASPLNGAELARRYGVTKQLISLIATGKLWR